jgi:hypothetical protein
VSGSKALKAQHEAERREKQEKKQALRRGATRPRKQGTRPKRERILVVCEGAKTEPAYFQAFVVAEPHEVVVVPAGDHTLSLVRRALSERADQGPFTETWVVLDRDGFKTERFKAALRLAQREGLKVAYTNEAFEAWFLMHFHYCDAALSRSTYEDRLAEALERPYFKNDPSMYATLQEKQATAIQNAERLLATYGAAHDPETDNPSTTVHLLVKRLNALR